MSPVNYNELTQDELNHEFHIACIKGDLDLVKHLLTSPKLKQHADIHFEEDDCIILACRHGKLEVLKYLLFSPDLKTHPNVHPKKESSFQWACTNGHLEIIKYFLFDPCINHNFNLKEYSYEAIIRGIYADQMKVIEYILNDPEITKHNFDYNKGRILEATCECGRLDILKYLVDLPTFNKNLDFHFDNDTCFKGAYYYSHLDVVEFLIFNLNLTKTEEIKKYINEYQNTNMHHIESFFNMRNLNNELHIKLNTNELNNKKLKV